MRLRFFRVISCVFHAWLLVSLLGGLAASAQHKGEVRVELANGQSKILYSHSHALVIGNDVYLDTPGHWPKLKHAISDAKAVKRVLEEEHGFEVEHHENLKSAELWPVIQAFFRKHGANHDARLFFWFAGHGHTIDNQGYLVSIDAINPDNTPAQKLEFTSTALPMQRFNELINTVAAKHILFVFDSCFSGSIFNNLKAQTEPSRYIADATFQMVRYFISSGGENEKVIDDGSFQRLFVGAISGGIDAPGGYVTGSQLGQYIARAVVDNNVWSTKQKPRFGSHARYSEGDFVFRIGPPKQAVLAPMPSSPVDPKVREACFSEPNIERRIAACTTVLGAGPRDVEILIERGYAYYVTAYFDQAEEAFERALEVEPENVTARILRANSHRYRHNTRKAERELLEVLKVEPNNTQALQMLGMTESALNRDKQAKETWRRALASLDNDPHLVGKPAKVASRRAAIQHQLGEYESALLSLNEAEAAGETAWRFHEFRGAAFLYADRIDPAINEFDAELANNPRNDSVLRFRAQAKCRRRNPGDIESGIVDAQQAIKLNFRHAWAYQTLGECYQWQNKHNLAIEAFNDAHTAKAEFADAFNGRGWSYLRTGELQRAVDDFTKALEYNKQLAFIWRNRGEARRLLAMKAAGADRQRLASEAKSDLDEAIRLDDKDERSHRYIGMLFDDLLSDPEKAFASFHKAVELAPEEPWNWFKRGMVTIKRGDEAAGLPDIEQAAARDDNFDDAFFVMAQVHFHQNRRVPALTDIDKALSIADRSDYRVLRCRIWLADNAATQALTDCTRAAELDRNNAEAFHHRGHAYEQRNNFTAAADDFTRFLELSPDNIHILFQRGEAYTELGNVLAAISDYSAVLTRQPRDWDALYARGYAYYKLDRHRDAIADYSLAIEVAPRRNGAWYYRGLAKGASGDRAGMRGDCQRALQLKPDDEDYWSCVADSAPRPTNKKR